MFHCVKVANPAGLVPLPFLGGAARRAAGGMIMPPNGVQGQRPWHAFGDFRRETKVTRVPSMARPCSRGAPAQGESRGATPLAYSGYAGALPLLQLPGETQSPLHLYPEKLQKLHPNVQPNRKKNKKRGGPPCLFGGEPLCMLRLTTHQHVPSNATCDPGKIIVPQLLKIAGKSVIITKLDCIH